MSVTYWKAKYVESLRRSGIRLAMRRFCKGCEAFRALKKEEVVGEKGFVSRDLTHDELWHYGLYGECVCGFEQEWRTWGKARPLEPCPRPRTLDVLIRCLGTVMELNAEYKKACAEKYRRFLAKKGFVYKWRKSCEGCAAFSPETMEEILKGDTVTSFDEMLRKNYYMGDCELGFKVKWLSVGHAVPLEECPKPVTQYELERCINYRD